MIPASFPIAYRTLAAGSLPEKPGPGTIGLQKNVTKHAYRALPLQQDFHLVWAQNVLKRGILQLLLQRTCPAWEVFRAILSDGTGRQQNRLFDLCRCKSHASGGGGFPSPGDSPAGASTGAARNRSAERRRASPGGTHCPQRRAREGVAGRSWSTRGFSAAGADQDGC